MDYWQNIWVTIQLKKTYNRLYSVKSNRGKFVFNLYKSLVRDEHRTKQGEGTQIKSLWMLLNDAYEKNKTNKDAPENLHNILMYWSAQPTRSTTNSLGPHN